MDSSWHIDEDRLHPFIPYARNANPVESLGRYLESMSSYNIPENRRRVWRKPRLIVADVIKDRFFTDDEDFNLEVKQPEDDLRILPRIYFPFFANNDKDINLSMKHEFEKTFLLHYYQEAHGFETWNYFNQRLEGFLNEVMPLWSRKLGVLLSDPADLNAYKTGWAVSNSTNTNNGTTSSDSETHDKNRSAVMNQSQARKTVETDPGTQDSGGDTLPYANQVSAGQTRGKAHTNGTSAANGTGASQSSYRDENNDLLLQYERLSKMFNNVYQEIFDLIDGTNFTGTNPNYSSEELFAKI